MTEQDGAERSGKSDELRRMLDELGVEWCELVGHPVVVGTAWNDRDGYPCTALEYADDVPDGILNVQANLTPEQAIEATLGSGTCHNVDIGTEGYFKCSECGTSCSVDWEESGWDEPNFCPNCGRRLVEVNE